MSLRYALLALLTARPMTGYELAKASHSSVGYVWHAPDSHIYPELRKMAADGLVVGVEEPRGKATKTAYRITDAGRGAFREWMDTPLEYNRERDPAHLKAAYFDWAKPDAARAQLEDHIAFHAERIQEWRKIIASLLDRSNETLAARLAAAGPTAHEEDRIVGYKVFAYEGLIGQAEEQIRWARAGLRLIDQLEGPVA